MLRVINKVNSKTKLRDTSEFVQYDEVVWLSLLANSISNVLSYFRHDSQMKILEHFHHALSNTPENIESFYQKSVDLLVLSPETLFKAAILRFLDPETQSLKIVAISLSEGVSDSRKNFIIKVGDGVAGWAAQNRSPLILPRIRINNDLVNFRDKKWINHDWIRENKFQTFGCFPLIAKGKLLGTLSFYTGCAYDFHTDIDGFTFIQTVAELIATFVFFNTFKHRKSLL